MKKPLAIALVTLLHAALSVGLFVFSFSRSMSRLDTANLPTMLERAAEAAVLVLHFPLMHLAKMAPAGWFPGLWGYLPLLLNSALWAAALVYGWFFLRKRRPEAALV